MNPKEKAYELVEIYYKILLKKVMDSPGNVYLTAKQCALIAVDEILSMKIVRKDDLTDEYWEEVQKEIEKL